MAENILITGGCRSGKSRQALLLADKIPGEKIYVATAEALDSEMTERIEMHKRERGEGWKTVEEPRELLELLCQIESRSGVLVLDCLTLWISNLLVRGFDGKFILREANRLTDQMKKMKCRVIVVSNEVGAGIVPENQLARNFRDLAGEVNQLVASHCDNVIHMVSGIPVTIKP